MALQRFKVGGGFLNLGAIFLNVAADFFRRGERNHAVVIFQPLGRMIALHAFERDDQDHNAVIGNGNINNFADAPSKFNQRAFDEPSGFTHFQSILPL